MLVRMNVRVWGRCCVWGGGEGGRCCVCVGDLKVWLGLAGWAVRR